ncbi:MAG: heme-binding domain-containing protein [Saprospiraceae bacterium]|nr:heme-binding domain-containing protein [Saprospiraceae bacterium]
MKIRIIYTIIIIFLVLQFFQIEKQNPENSSTNIFTKYETQADIKDILEKACFDCHSNETTYPWYSYVQPLGWWLQHHMEEGKEHLNFSDFTSRRIASQNHKFEEIIEMVKSKEMPIPSYTWMGMHKEAKLTDEERSKLTSWAQMQMDLLANSYPADSLVIKRKK